MSVWRALLEQRLQGRSRWGVASLLVVAAMATVGVVAGLEVRSGAEARLDRLFVEAGEPSLVVDGGPNAIPRVLEDQSELVEAASTFDATFVSFQRPDGASVGMGLATIDDAASVEVGRPILRSGRWAVAADELVLDAAAALAHGHTEGSVVTLERSGVTIDVTVVGTAIDLSECFYPTCVPLRGYVSSDGMASLAPEGTYSRAIVRLGAGVDEQEATERFRDAEGTSIVRPWSSTRASLLLPGQVFAAFLAGFGVFILVATLLVVASTAAGSVVARRRELGVWKALGATPRDVVIVTVMEQVVIGLAGVLIGWIAGSLLAPWLQIGLSDVLGRPTPHFSLTTLVLSGSAVVFVLVIATLLPARRAGGMNVRTALADAPTDGASAWRSLVSRVPLSPPAQLGLQLALARPGRAFLASLAIAVAIAGGVAGWRLDAAVDEVLAEPGRAGDPYDILVGVPRQMPAAQVEQLLAEIDGIDSWYTEQAVNGQVNGVDADVRVIGDQVGAAALVIAEGRMPRRADEALAGWGLLRNGAVRIGDTVDVDVPDGTFIVTVTGRHGDLDRSGNVIVISPEAYATVADPGRITWRVSAAGSITTPELAGRIEAAFGGAALVQPATQAAGELRPFQTVLAVLVALIALVAAANLAATLLATTQERRREMGVIRSLGFSPRELRRQAAASGLALGAIGMVIGVPGGLIASDLIVESAADEIGLGPDLLTPALLVPALIAVVIGLAAASLVSTASGRSMRRKAPARLLREA